MNYHTHSDFRSAHPAAFDELMSQLLAALMNRKLLTLARVAQDGTRVRASAEAGSFRRKPGLERCLEAARAHLAELRQTEDRPQTSARLRAARERAAREYQQRCAQALEQFAQLSAHKARAKDVPKRATVTRISTTNPAARVMKLGDSGFAPAYNRHFATDTASRIIVGVGVTNLGSDSRQLLSMEDEIKWRTGQLPRQHLADAGYLRFESIEQAAARRGSVGSPARAPRLSRSAAAPAARFGGDRGLSAADGFAARRSTSNVPPPPRRSTPISRPGADLTVCCCVASTCCLRSQSGPRSPTPHAGDQDALAVTPAQRSSSASLSHQTLSRQPSDPSRPWRLDLDPKFGFLRQIVHKLIGRGVKRT